MSVPGPSARDDCFPSWINVTKFVHGQTFFATHYGAIGIVEPFTLMGLLAIPQVSDVLGLTGVKLCRYSKLRPIKLDFISIIYCITATNDCPAR